MSPSFLTCQQLLRASSKITEGLQVYFHLFVSVSQGGPFPVDSLGQRTPSELQQEALARKGDDGGEDDENPTRLKTIYLKSRYSLHN